MSLQSDDLGRQLTRTFEFARHVPFHRLRRRLLLEGKRRVLERTGGFTRVGASQASWAASTTLPKPPFPARTGKCVRTAQGWRFTFLNLSRDTMATIDWNAGGRGPENQLWRMNLHYMEYLEEAANDDFQTLVTQWIEANPAFTRGYWRDSWNSYALSLRVVVWMQQLATRWTLLPPEFRNGMIASLSAQIEFLCANLETDIGGNHLIKNIKALAWAAAFFSGPPQKRLKNLALRLLSQELHTQILPDGMHFERSPSYHAQVLADLLEIRYALRGDPLHGALDRAIGAMAQAVLDLAHPDGGPAQFNDAGLTMCYSPAACLAAYHQLYGQAPNPRAVFAYPDAGYYGLRSDRLYVVADCGAIAPDELPAHGHGDVLSFECSLDGDRMIVDQGVFQYWEGERRYASRSARSHNTLCITDSDQADFFGSFRCGRRPAVTQRAYHANGDGFILEGSHDGFAHLDGRPIHVRRFHVTPTRIEIADQLEGGSALAATLQFLLHPDCVAVADAKGVMISRGASQMHLSCSAPLSIEQAVWWPDMGVEHATRRIVAHMAPGAQTAQTQIQVMM